MNDNNMITKKDAAIAFTVAVFVPAVLSVVLVSVAAMQGKSVEDISLWLQFAMAQGGILAAGLGLIFYKRQSIKQFAGFNRRPKTINILLLAVLSLSFILVMNPIVNLWYEVLQQLGYQSKLVTFDFTQFNLWQLLAAVLLMAVVPAFGEEIINRGFVLQGFRQKRLDLKAILISAALFAVMHKNVEQLWHPFVMGVVFGLIFCLTESIWNVIILHFFNNLFSIILSAVPTLGSFVNQSWWLMFVGLAVAAAVMRYIFVDSKTDDDIVAKKESDLSATFLFMAAAGYCFAIFVFGLF